MVSLPLPPRMVSTPRALTSVLPLPSTIMSCAWAWVVTVARPVPVVMVPLPVPPSTLPPIERVIWFWPGPSPPSTVSLTPRPSRMSVPPLPASSTLPAPPSLSVVSVVPLRITTW